MVMQQLYISQENNRGHVLVQEETERLIFCFPKLKCSHMSFSTERNTRR